MGAPDAGLPGKFHQLDCVGANERLAAREVDLVNGQSRELAQHVLPLIGAELILAGMTPAGTAHATQVAIFGQEELGDQGTDMEIGQHTFLQPQPSEESAKPESISNAHDLFRAVMNRFALWNSSPSSQMARSRTPRSR